MHVLYLIVFFLFLQALNVSLNAYITSDLSLTLMSILVLYNYQHNKTEVHVAKGEQRENDCFFQLIHLEDKYYPENSIAHSVFD